MTDRFHALTVVLEHDMRDDDAQALIDAIKQMRGVLNVRGEVGSPSAELSGVVRERERIARGLHEVLWSA